MALISSITGHPVAPAEVADAVTLWFRQWGRRAHMEWAAPLGCFVIKATRRPDDPVMRMWQEGRVAEEPMEVIYLHEPNPRGPGYLAIDPGMLGAGGIREWLDRANLWSGRGEHASIQSSADAVDAANDRHQEAVMSGERGRELAWLTRRKILDLPMVSVPRDILA